MQTRDRRTHLIFKSIWVRNSRPNLSVINTIDGVSLYSEDVGEIHSSSTNWAPSSNSLSMVVSNDEQGSHNIGLCATWTILSPTMHVEKFCKATSLCWCPVLFRTTFPGSNLNLQDFRSRDALLDQTRYALEFLGDNEIPFESMSSAAMGAGVKNQQSSNSHHVQKSRDWHSYCKRRKEILGCLIQPPHERGLALGIGRCDETGPGRLSETVAWEGWFRLGHRAKESIIILGWKFVRMVYTFLFASLSRL